MLLILGRNAFRFRIRRLDVVEKRVVRIFDPGLPLLVSLRQFHAALAEHTDKASDGKHAERIDRAALLRTVRENARSHSDGEFQNLHAARPRDQKMSQFMNEDQKAENENCQ